MNRKIFFLFLLGILSAEKSVSAIVAAPLHHYQLQGVEITGKKVRSSLKEIEGANVINMSLMDDMPRILGNADPMHYAQLLPCVQTNSEYDAGLHIQGCDNYHNLMRHICWVSFPSSMPDISMT